MTPEDPQDDRPVAELRELLPESAPEFTRRLHRRIDRRVLARDLSVMGWELPKILARETLFVFAAWLGGPKDRSRGGRS